MTIKRQTFLKNVYILLKIGIVMYIYHYLCSLVRLPEKIDTYYYRGNCDVRYSLIPKG